MALIWLRLYMWDRDERFLSAALKSIDLAKAAQFMTSRNPGIQGGIPGSHPVWGGDISMAIPNWAAKYFIDALLAKKSVLAGLEQRPKQRWRIPSDVPVRLPESATEVTQKLTTVFYAAPSSTKVAAFVEAWRSWGFRPEYVVLEATPKRCVRRHGRAAPFSTSRAASTLRCR